MKTVALRIGKGVLLWVILLMTLAFQVPPVLAQTAEYEWNTTYKSTLTVFGLVSDASDRTYGYCRLYDDGTFNCYEDDHGIDRNYTGTYAIVGINRNKIKFVLDSHGLQEYVSMLTSWAEELADEEGVSIGGISFDLRKVNISIVTISKKSGVPSKAVLTVKGKVSAYLDGKNTRRNFSSTSRIKFY